MIGEGWIIIDSFVRRNQFKTLLDLRRANNVSIGLSRYTRRGLTAQTICTAIRSMDSTLLTLDDLTAIQNLLPTPDEKALLSLYNTTSHDNETLPLAPAEQFMLDTMQHPDLTHHLDAFMFKLHLESESADLLEKLDKLDNVARLLRKSEGLKVLLRTVLELGNLTNYQYGAGGGGFKPWMGNEARALGFKIEGLARLKDVKSADGKWSLMSFLVDMVTQSRPDVSHFSHTILPLFYEWVLM